MHEAITNFHKQFAYEPKIRNQSINKKDFRNTGFVVVGMGGSALAPKLLKTCKPSLDILVHSDYGLPHSPDAKDKLYIFSSYSGNTEETIDAFQKAKANKFKMAVVTTGGKLLALAIKNKVPYIQIPDTGIQPRMALGFSIKAFLKLLGEEAELKKISKLAKSLKYINLEKAGKKLAERIVNNVPVIYASNRNLSLAYNWKIKFNETGKIPAFYNTFPELNHNEMTGFDVKDSTRKLSDKFYFILLQDPVDDPKILRRMKVLEKLYKDQNLKTEIVSMKGSDLWHRIFSSLILADWAAYYTSQGYGLESEQVPMVEEFKNLISR